MQESDDPSKATEPPPEAQIEVDQLLKLLELQRADRERRIPARDRVPSGMAFRYLGLAIIVVGTIVSVIVLEYMLSQIQQRPRAALPPMPTPPGQH